MDLLTFLQGFFLGATLAFIVVAIWECRDMRRSMRKYDK